MSKGEVFVGRERELERATHALARASVGTGALLLLSGPAGIGKTALARAIAERAATEGARVVWGRAWESGGAPSYWPWIQIFRALGLADPFVADMPGAELQQARFAIFDRATRSLKAEARAEVVVVLLDDLHAADLSTVLFLQFLARDPATSRLLVVGTYREVEARLAGEVGTILGKIEREADALALPKLTRADVTAWVTAAGATSDADHVFVASEGNALFVHEILRVGSTKPALGLRAIIDEHLARIGPDAREILRAGSVLGRELDAAAVAMVSKRSVDEVMHALRAARDAGVLDPIGDRHSFTHILLREQLYEELAPSAREALHLLAAERSADAANALHHLERGAAPPERLAEAGLEAARIALSKLAFEDAHAFCRRALDVRMVDDALTVHLEIAAGEALMRAGMIDRGREVCSSAAARAKRIGSSSLLGEAALAYATELITGTVDPTMVRVLRDAVDALPDEDSTLLARVLARYAASLVPPDTDDEALEVVARGEAAIAMARRTGDRDTLIFALHYGGSAAGYIVSTRRRFELMRELATLAHDRPLVLLATLGWWSSALREQGALEESRRASARLVELVEARPEPHYRLRLPLARSTDVALAGDFDEAIRIVDDALVLAEGANSFSGRMGWMLQRVAIAHLRDDPGSIAPIADRILALIGGMSGMTGFIAWVHAAVGRDDEARRRLDEVLLNARHFPWLLIGGDAAARLGDDALSARFYPVVCERAEANSIFWGPFGTAVLGPLERIAGDLAHQLGRDEEARSHWRTARAIGERMRAPAITDAAERRLASLDASEANVTSVTRRPLAIKMQREGETWRIDGGTAPAFVLKDSKGLAYLADLVAHPNQERHVAQLCDAEGIESDGGAVLDVRAKKQYAAELESLRERLEEARAFGDMGKTAKLEEAIDMIARELANALGLGGRDRKMGSQIERLRINVQRCIRASIERIAEHDPSLGRMLMATIRTGNFCVFTPI